MSNDSLLLKISEEISNLVKENKYLKKVIDWQKSIIKKEKEKLKSFVAELLTSDEVRLPIPINCASADEVVEFLRRREVPFRIMKRMTAVSNYDYHVDAMIIKVPAGYIHVAVERNFAGEIYCVLKREEDEEFLKKLSWVRHVD